MSSNKQQYAKIVHPDQFIEGEKYSVVVESKRGPKRVVGVFIEMETEWCVVCQKYHLLICLRRSNGKIGVVYWGDMGVRDWREVT